MKGKTITLRFVIADYDVKVLKNALNEYLCRKRIRHEMYTAQDLLGMIERQEEAQKANVGASE